MAGPLLDVLNLRIPTRRPVWLMRQAGRYLPEYRDLRQKAGSFLDLCYNPAMAAEVTLQPLHRFDLDAAILFSDILVVPHGMGLGLKFVENEGPLLDTVRDASGVAELKLDGGCDYFVRVAETVARVKSGLATDKTLIGFCGAPWTVATYMIEGRSSDRKRSVAIAEESPGWFVDLMAKLVDVSVAYLKLQIEAGAEVVQIFDSWAGDLPGHLREPLVHQPIARMVALLRESYPAFPVIVFARGVGLGHVKVAAATEANAVSIEQGVRLRDLLAGLPSTVAVQGNLDPQLLLGPGQELEAEVTQMLQGVPMARHIFNLGHGIQQQTSPKTVTRLVDMIRKHDAA
jgi:uroporphyrinogen decarboxylase